MREILLSQYVRGDQEFYGPSRYGLPFMRTSNGNYQSPSGIDATLMDNGSNTYTLTFNKTGLQYHFSADALSNITDQNGNTISFSYDSNKHLTGITDTQGRVTTVSENAGGFITSTPIHLAVASSTATMPATTSPVSPMPTASSTSTATPAMT